MQNGQYKQTDFTGQAQNSVTAAVRASVFPPTVASQSVTWLTGTQPDATVTTEK